MNESRRSILKLLPFAGVALPASKLLGEDPPADVEVVAVPPPDEKKHRPLMILRLKQAASQERICRLREELRSGLDRLGFAYMPAIVLPAYVDCDIYSIPEGAEKCSDSERSN